MRAKPFRVVVATDFSPCSEHALEIATSLVADRQDDNRNAEVYLLHVVDAVIPTYDEDLGVLEPETLRANLEALAASRKSGLPIETIVKHGKAVEQILLVAEKKDADLLVLGTHGRTGIRHALMGSVAEAVLRSASCPVMTVKGPVPVPSET